MSQSLGCHHKLAADLVAVSHPSKFASGFGEVSRILGEMWVLCSPCLFSEGTRMGSRSGIFPLQWCHHSVPRTGHRQNPSEDDGEASLHRGCQ